MHDARVCGAIDRISARQTMRGFWAKWLAAENELLALIHCARVLQVNLLRTLPSHLS